MILRRERGSFQYSSHRWRYSVQANWSGQKTIRPGKVGGGNCEPWNYQIFLLCFLEKKKNMFNNGLAILSYKYTLYITLNICYLSLTLALSEDVILCTFYEQTGGLPGSFNSGSGLKQLWVLTKTSNNINMLHTNCLKCLMPTKYG